MTTASDDRHIRPFASVLRDLGKGSVHDELGRQLADLTMAVVEHDKKGTLVLKLTVEPNGDAYNVTAETTLTAPKAKPTTVFFADDDGNLTRTDPRQEALGLREVAKIGETA